MAAPEPGPAAAFDAASDRAALLRYVLDHVLERCALPDGVSNAAHLISTAWTSPRCSRPFASPGATGPARRDGKHRGSAERGGRVERDRDERRFRLPPGGELRVPRDRHPEPGREAGRRRARAAERGGRRRPDPEAVALARHAVVERRVAGCRGPRGSRRLRNGFATSRRRRRRRRRRRAHPRLDPAAPARRRPVRRFPARARLSRTTRRPGLRIRVPKRRTDG